MRQVDERSTTANPCELTDVGSKKNITMAGRRVVALLDPWMEDAHDRQPESLCGSRILESTFLRNVGRLSAKFDLSIVLSGLVDSLAGRPTHSDLPVHTCDEFIAAHRDNGEVLIQCLGHRIDRAGLLRRRAGMPSWRVYGMTHDLFDPAVFDALVSFSLWFSGPDGDAVICASRTGRLVYEHYCDRIRATTRSKSSLELPIIPHGVDERTIHRSPRELARARLGLRDEAVFLYFGRLSLEHKADLLGLINCFTRNFGGRPATLIIAGSAVNAPNNSSIRQILRLIGSSQSVVSTVRLHVNVSAELKSDLFSAADVFVSPANSLQETFGLAIVEAMLYQLPVVCTAWSGYNDIVVDQVTGHLIPVRRRSGGQSASIRERSWLSVKERTDAALNAVSIDWALFGQRLIELADNRTRRIQLGTAGLIRARANFSMTAMVQSFGSAWDSALSRKSDSESEGPGLDAVSLDRLLDAALNP